jgi:hypothetical protein
VEARPTRAARGRKRGMKNKVLLDNNRVEVRLNDDGTIDEIDSKKPVHVTYEYMDKDAVHLRIGDVAVLIGARIPKGRKRPLIRTGAYDAAVLGGQSYGEFDE